ncbi:DeoR family transcriptional regulator [Virgibacillus oceani]|uniref:HTH-type transcriptional repressor YcnK n=1 Tax=Virgibacillus oceani TaxID=1479511 RepID=A0A917H8D2_9BACI|nr:DeoR family transcriptional regulator [Virgibacillus oceani]GGG70785.1 HTH-type transcriptional repressor YcnK [Virgibacillus oceani]
MLPLERQNKIKELIQEKENMKIAELSKELNVSEMTIHRDLKPLIDKGIIVKTFGGISLAKGHSVNTANPDACIFCSRKINERMAYRLILPNNKIEMACCAHCGLLRHRQLGDEVMQAICPDFFKQTTISAKLAWYVMDTSLHIGCCHPQVLTFEWKEHAEKFVKGFGGRIFSFHDAVEEIFQKMNGHEHGCSKHH